MITPKPVVMMPIGGDYPSAWFIQNWKHKDLVMDLTLTMDGSQIVRAENIRRIDGQPLGSNPRTQIHFGESSELQSLVFAAWRAWMKTKMVVAE